MKIFSPNRVGFTSFITMLAVSGGACKEREGVANSSSKGVSTDVKNDVSADAVNSFMGNSTSPLKFFREIPEAEPAWVPKSGSTVHRIWQKGPGNTIANVFARQPDELDLVVKTVDLESSQESEIVFNCKRSGSNKCFKFSLSRSGKYLAVWYEESNRPPNVEHRIDMFDVSNKDEPVASLRTTAASIKILYNGSPLWDEEKDVLYVRNANSFVMWDFLKDPTKADVKIISLPTEYPKSIRDKYTDVVADTQSGHDLARTSGRILSFDVSNDLGIFVLPGRTKFSVEDSIWFFRTSTGVVKYEHQTGRLEDWAVHRRKDLGGDLVIARGDDPYILDMSNPFSMKATRLGHTLGPLKFADVEVNGVLPGNVLWMSGWLPPSVGRIPWLQKRNGSDFEIVNGFENYRNSTKAYRFGLLQQLRIGKYIITGPNGNQTIELDKAVRPSNGSAVLSDWNIWTFEQ